MEAAKEILTRTLERYRRPIIVAQKDGRTTDAVIQLIKECVEERGGTTPDMLNGDRRLVYPIPTFRGASIVFTKYADIVKCLEKGDAQLGVAGNDMRLETRPQVSVLAKVRENVCSLEVLSRRRNPINSLKELNGEQMASCVPYLAVQLLAERDVFPKVVDDRQGVEAAVSAFRRYRAGVERVETGTTAAQAGLVRGPQLMQCDIELIGPKKKRKR